jgi:hypothetical protein
MIRFGEKHRDYARPFKDPDVQWMVTAARQLGLNIRPKKAIVLSGTSRGSKDEVYYALGDLKKQIKDNGMNIIRLSVEPAEFNDLDWIVTLIVEV